MVRGTAYSKIIVSSWRNVRRVFLYSIEALVANSSERKSFTFLSLPFTTVSSFRIDVGSIACGLSLHVRSYLYPLSLSFNLRAPSAVSRSKTVSGPLCSDRRSDSKRWGNGRIWLFFSTFLSLLSSIIFTFFVVVLAARRR